MAGCTTVALLAALLLVGMVSARPYGPYKSPHGPRGAAGLWDGYGGYWGNYPGYYGHYDGWGFDRHGHGAFGGGDSSYYNAEYPSYYNSFCNCNGNARCIIDCESSHSYMFAS